MNMREIGARLVVSLAIVAALSALAGCVTEATTPTRTIYVGPTRTVYVEPTGSTYVDPIRPRRY
jgi:hypothetical protein